MRPPTRLGTCLVIALALLAARAVGAEARVAEEARAQAEREGRARVIVRLAAPSAVGAASALHRAAIVQAADASLARIGGSSRPELRRYQVLPLLALEVSPRELAELAEAPEVLAIEADRQNSPSLGYSIPRVGANVSTNAGWDGSGSAVAILDTGVESSHSFFEGRVVVEACFSSGRDCPGNLLMAFGPGSAIPCNYGTLCYHGTHVAGIAAGQTATAQGVAPGADIIAIQVGSKYTTGCGTAGSPCVLIDDSDVLLALDYVVGELSPIWNIAAVNMSFGGNDSQGNPWPSESSCDADNGAYKETFDVLRSLGIAPVAAAGNNSSATGISAPACVSSAVGVGATNNPSSSATADVVASISNVGPPLDLFAPGLVINSSKLGNSFGTASGTSMASPHVAGAFAVLRQADPSASVTTLLDALSSSGVPKKDFESQITRPRIQVDDAVRARAPAACFDGLDNDSDGNVDVDGDGGTPDPDCTNGFDTSESPPPPPPGCGIGPELALLLPLLAALRRRRAGR